MSGQTKPKIFLYCVALGTGTGMVNGSLPGGDVLGCALAEDGTGIVSHLSSSVAFSKHDLGLTSDWKHEFYQRHYPDGFELEWIDEADLRQHEGFKKAIALNKASAEAVTEKDLVFEP